MKEFRFTVGPFMFSVNARTEEDARDIAEHALARGYMEGLPVPTPDDSPIKHARVYPWDNIDQLELYEVLEDEPDYGGTHEKVM